MHSHALPALPKYTDYPFHRPSQSYETAIFVRSYEILIFAPVFPSRIFMRRRILQSRHCAKNEVSMLDLMFIAIGLGFLAGAMLYAVACDRL
jgi:hypothetical protein